MPTKHIEEFAKNLVLHVRDAAIRDCDMNRSEAAQSLTAKRWRQLRTDEPDALAEKLIPDCIDVALFFLLNAVDQGTLRLQFVADGGEVVDLATDGDGELAGWYIGTDGWRSTYSQERSSDFAGTGAP